MGIEIKNLSISYGKKQVLKDLDLSLEDGQVVGLVGENGCGKTTLLRILAGLEKGYQGKVLLNGKKPGEEANIFTSYQPDHLPFDDKVRLREIGEVYNEFFPDFNLDKYRKIIGDFDLDLDMKVEEVSKGMKDKVQIASSLAREADIYLMDEPMSGIDPKARKTVLNVIIDNFDSQGIMIISTHLITQIERILDRVIFMGEGRIIVNDTVDNIREKKHMGIEEYFEEVY